MNVLFDTTADDFLSKTRVFLEENEERDHQLFALCLEIQESGWRGPPPAFVSVIRDRGVVGAAVHVPGHPAMLATTIPSDAAAIARRMHEARAAVDSVIGPTSAAESFAKEWTALTGRPSALAAEQTLRRATRVQAPHPPSGRLRVARESETPIVVNWMTQFAAEAMRWETRTEKQIADDARSKLLRRQVFLLESDGEPVAMASFSGSTPRGIRINTVYVPQERRGRGFGKNVAARLAQQLLISGRGACFVSHDKTSAALQHLYESIGFEPVCDTRVYLFQPG